MTEEEARQETADLVSRETMLRIEAFVSLLLTESAHQNLISASSTDTLWSRHILDSAQLLKIAEANEGLWVDVGSGAGLPGIVVALARPQATLLIEPRTKRAAFLDLVIAELGISQHTQVAKTTAEKAFTQAPAAIVSARAVAALPAIFAMAEHLSGPATLWLLPKGRSAAAEVASLAGAWQGEIGLVPSLTDSEAAIVVARRVRREGQG